MKTMMLCLATLLMSGAAMADGVFYVQGDVVSPGKYSASGKESVREAITQAGGFATTADKANICLVRDGKVLRITDDPKTDYLMRAGDRLVIYRKASRPASR